jgi:AcrR family transcriptional regulator
MNVNKNPNQLRKTTAAKEKIYDSAMSLLYDNAYDNLTIRNICRAAGISIGTFYHYFAGKDDLITYIIARGYDEYKKKYDDPKASPPRRVVDIFAYEAGYLSGLGLNFLSNILSANNQGWNPYYILTRESYNKDIAQDLIRYIQQARDAGMVNENFNLRMIFDELSAIFYGNVFHWCLSGGKYELTNSMKKMMTVYFNLYLNEEFRIEM